MRNFSTVTTAAYQTYTVNGGEYVQDDVSLTAVAESLAVAFETNTAHVLWDFFHHAVNGESEGEFLSSSEYRVLLDLANFAEYVRASIRENGFTTVTRVFSYSNLNTGKSVTWVHSVC